jgi:hypothetical protein
MAETLDVMAAEAAIGDGRDRRCGRGGRHER